MTAIDLELCFDALATGNSIRLRRSTARERIASAETKHESLRLLATLIRERPEYMDTAEIYSVLKWARRVGRVDARKIWSRFHPQWAPDKMFVELTDRQAGYLADALCRMAARAEVHREADRRTAARNR